MKESKELGIRKRHKWDKVENKKKDLTDAWDERELISRRGMETRCFIPAEKRGKASVATDQCAWIWGRKEIVVLFCLTLSDGCV